MRTLLLLLVQVYLYSSVNAQVIIDTSYIPNHSVYFNDGLSNGNLFYTTIFKTNPQNIRYVNDIYVYNDSLTLIDSINGNQTGRTNLKTAVAGLFKFNSSNYVFARNPQYDISIHKISGNKLIDSTKLNFDTITRTFPYYPNEINPNRLRLIGYEYNSFQTNIIKSKVIDLDSNFNVIDYHAFDFSQNNLFPTSQSQLLSGLYQIDNNTWHLHTNGALHIYNPQTNTIDTSRYLWGDSRVMYPVNNNEYLALGIVSFIPPLPGFPYLGMNALGFYRMRNDGTPIDTSYFLNIDNSATNRTDVSHEKMSLPTVVVNDTNNIYLASSTSYQKSNNAPLVNGFFVVKTDSRGTEKWRYSWIDTNQLSTLSGLLPSSDNGCVLLGSFTYEFPTSPRTAALLIKLGPDGTISNVKLDAPETVINFYPNPVKDKLYYNYLPEANGNYTLEIIDMQGKPVQDVVLENAKGFIPVSLQSGFYLYHLKSDNGKVEQVGRLVVE